MNTQKFTQNELFFDDDKKMLNDLRQFFYSGMIFVDIDADLGRYTFEVNNYINQSSIYAIESNLSKCNQLKNNCTQWEFLSDNTIHILNINLSNEQKAEKSSLTYYKLDTFFKRIDPCLIKINRTGNELKILQGSTGLLKKGKARFLLVNNYEEIPNKADIDTQICEFMRSFGYYPQKFGEKYLFTNPRKHLFHRLKRLYRQILPEAFRSWLKSFTRQM
ncbi:MAG: hypothetical protein QNJ42_20515 [Crocosphaera sp.]|nr:hypothetical protein [Crocosphaera sp.]